MIEAALLTATILVVLVGGSLVRVALGPTDADRMLGVQLLGSSMTALPIVLAIGLQIPRLFDLALVMALLAGVTTAVFAVSNREGDMRDERP